MWPRNIFLYSNCKKCNIKCQSCSIFVVYYSIIFFVAVFLLKYIYTGIHALYIRFDQCQQNDWEILDVFAIFVEAPNVCGKFKWSRKRSIFGKAFFADSYHISYKKKRFPQKSHFLAIFFLQTHECYKIISISYMLLHLKYKVFFIINFCNILAARTPNVHSTMICALESL